MSSRNKSKKQGRKRQKASADAEERDPSSMPPPPATSRAVAMSPTPPPDAAAVDEVLEDVSVSSHAGDASETLPTVGKGKGRGKKSNEKVADQQLEKKTRKTFSLPTVQEDAVFEWLEENELLWRRGHRIFKDTNRKKALWEEKGKELDVSIEHLQGWWRGMHTWYVKLHKVKSGQAAKKLTDREKYVLQKCSFYEGELRHRSSVPMKPLPRDMDPDATEAASDAGSEVESVLPVDADRDDEVEAEGLLSNIEKTAAHASKGAVYSRVGTSRSTKRTRQDAEEEEFLREIRDSMKANTQLLSQFVGEKSSSHREPFITYMSDTLRRLPDHQYDAIMRNITSMLQNLNTTDFSPYADLPSIQTARPRPSQSQSAPPRDLYQPYTQYQQPQRPAYSQYHPTQQFQQPQPPAFPQYQPAQSQQPADQPRRSADSLSQVLELTHGVLDGSPNLSSLSGLGDDSLSYMRSLNTPPAPLSSTPATPQTYQ